MERHTVRQGQGLALDVTLRDRQGRALTSVYTGSEPLSARIWPGDDRPVAITPTAAWNVAAMATVILTVDDLATAAADPGVYLGELLIVDGGDTYPAYEFRVEILPAPGTAVLLKTYCSYDDLLDKGRSWVSSIAGGGDQAGYPEQRGRARTWFDNLLHARDRNGGGFGLGTFSFSPGAGWHSNGRIRNRWLADQLAADKLLVRDEIRDACTHYSLYLLTEGQIGQEDDTRWLTRAAWHLAAAERIACGIIAELDTNGDGYGDYAIDLTFADTRMG